MLNKINISPQKQTLIIYVALIVVTLAVFGQVHQFDFVNIDDDKYVTENSYVQSGITLNGVLWAFSTTHAEYWHPLTWLSLMFDYQLFGLNAGGYHVINLIIHIMSTLLLFWLFNRMTGEIWKSVFVAALFALHPLRVESVVWVAKRRDVLCVFFWMLTLCLYFYYTQKPVIKRYLLVIFSFILALLSKPMVITLPLVMILLDYWPLKRFESKKENLFSWQLKEKIPFFVLTAVFSVITIYARDYSTIKIFSLNSRFANALVSFTTYLEKTFWPHDMTVLQLFSDKFPTGQVLGSILLIIVISFAAIIAAKRLPYLFVGWLWYAITILPTLGIIQFGHLAMSDHHTYLPSIGIAVMLAWGFSLLFPCEELHKKILLPAGIIFIAIMAVLTWKQCGYWKNNTELYNHALMVTKDNALIHSNLGLALSEEGKNEEAINHFNEAIRLKPDFSPAYLNRGVAYGKLGQYQQAIANYNEVVSLKPDDNSAYYNRGNAYYSLGQYPQSIKDYSEAISLAPNYLLAYLNRGNAYTKLGQYQKAVEDYSSVIRLKADFAEAYSNRGIIYLLQGNKERGCHDAKKVCELGNCKLLDIAKGKGDCQ